ncbi:MAG TPA: 4-alpha-glucanotransferase [Deltaproteobacteria bacterium]|nr:4-alpha-glucanotransferase [Deltaproteobacteria bacterium]
MGRTSPDIYSRYRDVLGAWHRTPEETRSAIEAAMQGSQIPGESKARVVRPGRVYPIEGDADLVLEDGTIVKVRGSLPRDIPYGYHQLRPLEGDKPVFLIASPGCCVLPERRRDWGWAVQLYALRSRKSWGIGDLADLREFARRSRQTHGAGIILINPLLAVNPVLPQQSSPYYPTSRRYRNPLYLRVEEVPGAPVCSREIESLADAGRGLNHERIIDRNEVFRLKMKALDCVWKRFGTTSSFDGYCTRQGDSLHSYACFCVLVEHFGGGWHSWPGEYRHPASAAVARFAEANTERIRFHQWLQWLLDEQLACASRELPIMQDLPVGFDPQGFDAWAWQDILAREMSVGAPPDEFSAQGQDWGLAPFVPARLRACEYLPFRETIQASLSHAKALRIDHVMGLFRQFWIPKGMSPAMGAYVRFPAQDLLAIIALESYRSGAFIVGEDLGTVQQEVRRKLAQHHMLSSRLLWFEEKPPGEYPKLALASVTTHDLPTIAGLWSGTDLHVQQNLGLRPNVDGTRQIRNRLKKIINAPRNTPIDEVIKKTHRMLAGSPSLIVTATLDDALGVHERPNMPGTLSQWPNWSISLPLSREEIEDHPLLDNVARVIAQARKGEECP